MQTRSRERASERTRARAREREREVVVATIMRGKGLGNKIDLTKTSSGGDLTSALTDELLTRILRRLPPTSAVSNSLVCKRWMRLHGQLKLSIKLYDWYFLESGRMTFRFPNLTDVDLTRACIVMRRQNQGSCILLTHQGLTVQLGFDAVDPASIERCIEEQQLSPVRLDKGLKILADSCPGLQRLCVFDVRHEAYVGGDGLYANEVVKEIIDDHFEFIPPKVAGYKEGKDVKFVESINDVDFTSKLDGQQDGQAYLYSPMKKVTDVKDIEVSWTETEHGGGILIKTKPVAETGIASIAKNCPMLQELELYQCTDETLKAVSACANLQIVRLVGSMTGFYHCTFTDVGLTILSRTFRRLVSLELSGCEASYRGISAIGKSCEMLEELTLSNKGFHEGWLAALSFLTCLKTLRLEGCKQIDRNPVAVHQLGRCKELERLQLVRCDLRDRVGFSALLAVCLFVKELEFQDCWGLDDDTFSLVASCRRIRLLSLAGCSLITVAGLSAVVQGCKDLQRLRVTFCDNIRDSELTPALHDRFATLKEFTWRPDTKSVLAAGLAGTGVGQKGGRFFKRG